MALFTDFYHSVTFITMLKISQAVEEAIQRSPFLKEAMAEKIANNSKVAKRIRPYIEKKLLKKVSLASIAMALHRIQKGIDKTESGISLLKQMRDITVRSNLIAFAYPNSSDLTHLLNILSKNVSSRKESFLNFSRGLSESLIIVSKDFENEISPELKKIAPPKKIEELSAITMRLPESSFETPGVYYPILKAIALEGISFVEVMSVRTELSIIFHDKDIDRAFSVIKRITG